MTPPSCCLCPFPLRNLFFVSVSCFGRQCKRLLHCRRELWRVLIIDDWFAFCSFNFSDLFTCEFLPFYVLNGCKDTQSYSPHDDSPAKTILQGNLPCVNYNSIRVCCFYVPLHLILFSSPIIPKQNRSHHSNVVCDGSRLRIYLETTFYQCFFISLSILVICASVNINF